MTLLAEPDNQLAASEGRPMVPARRRFPVTGQPPLRQIVTAVLAGIVALLVVWLVCADPIAHIWYNARQGSLTAQALSAGTQLGSQVVRTGDQVGVLEVAQASDPTAVSKVVIAQGDSPGVLHGGPGHVPGTPLPGARGNSVVVGHNRDWGEPFRDLGQLTVGAKLYLQARPGVYKLPDTGFFVYTVTSVRTTTASDTRVMAPSTDYRLTLITNAGSRLSGNKVLVVTAVSGSLGKAGGPAPRSSLQPPRGSFFSGTLLRFLVEVAVAAAVIVLLRRRHRLVMAVTVASPLAMLAAWTLFLEFDAVAFRPLA